MLVVTSLVSINVQESIFASVDFLKMTSQKQSDISLILDMRCLCIVTAKRWKGSYKDDYDEIYWSVDKPNEPRFFQVRKGSPKKA